MPPYLTFTTTKVKIKLPSYFFPNSHGCFKDDFVGNKSNQIVWNYVATYSYSPKILNFNFCSKNLFLRCFQKFRTFRKCPNLSFLISFTHVWYNKLIIFFSFYYTKIPFCLISFSPERNNVFSLYYFTLLLAYSSHTATKYFIDVCRYSFWSPYYTVRYITQITDGDLFGAPCTAEIRNQILWIFLVWEVVVVSF